MSLPTPEQFLNRLASSPADGLAFDRATRRERPHCKSRREAVEATLNAVRATIAETLALKAKLAASRAKAAALEAANLSQFNLMKANPSATKAPTATAPAVKLTTAADYQKSITPPTMTRTEFHKLTPIQRSQWIRDGGKLV